MLNNYLNKVLKVTFSSLISTISLRQTYPHIILRGSTVPILNKFIAVLKYSSLFRMNIMSEFTAYDNPLKSTRFTLNIILLSIEYNYRLVCSVNLGAMQPIPSLNGVYSNSNWSERELRDMFGLYFTNNSDLRRLLTDYGFEGFPLRKDFPLTGYFEVRYDDEKAQILYEPVELAQEFRLFSLTSPWEKTENNKA